MSSPERGEDTRGVRFVEDASRRSQQPASNPSGAYQVNNRRGSTAGRGLQRTQGGRGPSRDEMTNEERMARIEAIKERKRARNLRRKQLKRERREQAEEDQAATPSNQSEATPRREIAPTGFTPAQPRENPVSVLRNAQTRPTRQSWYEIQEEEEPAQASQSNYRRGNGFQTEPLTEFNDENQHLHDAQPAPATRVVTPRTVRTSTTPQQARYADRPIPFTAPPIPQGVSFPMRRPNTLRDTERRLESYLETLQPGENMEEIFELDAETTSIAYEILREPEEMSLSKIKHIQDCKQLFGLLTSLACHMIMKVCGLESNYTALANQSKRLLFQPMGTLVNTIKKDNEARKTYKKFSLPFPPDLSPSKIAPIDFPEMIGPKKMKELLSDSPSIEACQKALEYFLKRTYPHDYCRICEELKNKNIPAKVVRKLIHVKGALTEWIEEWTDLKEVTFSPPRISCLKFMQADIDEARNAELEEISSVMSVQLEQEDSRIDQQNLPMPTILEQNPKLPALKLNQDEQLLQDLITSATPMAFLMEHSQKNKCQVVVSRAKAMNSLEIVGMEVQSYGAILPTDTPVANMKVPLERLKLNDPTVVPDQRKESLIEEVLKPFIKKNLKEAFPVLTRCLEDESAQDVVRLACAPQQLEMWVEQLDLAMCKPIDQTQDFNDEDKAVEQLELKEFCTIIQFNLDNKTDPTLHLEELENFASKIRGKHYMTIQAETEVQPNLSETEISPGYKERVIRVYLKTSFEFKEFLKIPEEESMHRQYFANIVKDTRGGFEIFQSYQADMKLATILLGIGPELAKQGLKEKIMGMKGMLAQPDQLEVVWSSIKRGEEDIPAVVVLAGEETVPHVVKVIGAEAFKFKGVQLEPIEATAHLDNIFYKDTFMRHKRSTQNKQVIFISGLPQWFDALTLRVTTAMLGEDSGYKHADWTVRDLLTKWDQEARVTEFQDETVLQVVTRGPSIGTLVLEYKEGRAESAWNLVGEIKNLLTKAAGVDLEDLEIKPHPSIHKATQREALPFTNMHMKSSEAEETKEEAPSSSDEESLESDMSVEISKKSATPKEDPKPVKPPKDDMHKFGEQLEKLTVSLTSLESEVSSMTSSPWFQSDQTLPSNIRREMMAVAMSAATAAIEKYTQEVNLEESVKKALQSQMALDSVGKLYEDRIQSILKSDNEKNAEKLANRVLAEIKNASKQPLIATPQNQDVSPPSKDFPTPSKCLGISENSMGADRTIGSAMEELQPHLAAESDSGKDKSLFEAATKTPNLKEFYTPHQTACADQAKELASLKKPSDDEVSLSEEIDSQAEAVSNLSDTSVVSAIKPKKLETATSNEDEDDETYVESSVAENPKKTFEQARVETRSYKRQKEKQKELPEGKNTEERATEYPKNDMRGYLSSK